MNNYMNIMSKKFELIDALENLEIFNELNELNDLINKDSILVSLIKQFNDVKKEYDDVNKYGKYHPDYDTVSKRLITIKTNLYNQELIKQYKAKEIELSDLIKEINFQFESLKSPQKCEKTSR